jgi:hypothetical protein
MKSRGKNGFEDRKPIRDVYLTTLYQCEFQDITTLYPLSIGILFYCYNTNKEGDE